MTKEIPDFPYLPKEEPDMVKKGRSWLYDGNGTLPLYARWIPFVQSVCKHFKLNEDVERKLLSENPFFPDWINCIDESKCRFPWVYTARRLVDTIQQNGPSVEFKHYSVMWKKLIEEILAEAEKNS